MKNPWLRRIFTRLQQKPKQSPPHEREEYEVTIVRKAPFRFPLVKDHEPIGLILEEKPDSVYGQLPEREDRREHSKQMTQGGWLTKASDVPSPVYGYQRPTANEENHVSNIQVANRKQDPTENKITEAQNFDSPSNHRMEKDVLHGSVEKVDLHAQSKTTEPIVNISRKQEETNEIETHPVSIQKEYQFPKYHFLKPSPKVDTHDYGLQQQMVERLEKALHSFGVSAKVTGVQKGPTVTRIEVQPAPGVKVNRITNLTDDIKLNLAVKDIRIEAPIPGKSAVGIEVPNLIREPVQLLDIITSTPFKTSKSPLTVALGKDIEGKPVVMDLCKMPHGLIAGSTGSGKSVCINSIIISLLYKATPDEVKLILIDPKMVELAPYGDLPHLATPVVTDPKQATIVLKWAVEEMERRYELFAQYGVRDIQRYNDLMATKHPNMVKPALPYILVVIDELADLMMVAPGDVEESIARIAQKARACGIHLLLATQRPSVDVITGMIKANVPTRIAFAVSSQIDSRTILDSAGAERLLGQGDMLLLESGSHKPIRIQGNFVSDEEIEKVCRFVREQRKPAYMFDKESLISSFDEKIDDDLFMEALWFVIEQEQASASLLQRRFRIGYNRAARLIDMMEQRGYVSEALGSKPRNVLLTKEEFHELFSS